MLILPDCIQKLPKRRNLCLTINSPYTTDSKIFNIDEDIIVSVINDDLTPLRDGYNKQKSHSVTTIHHSIIIIEAIWGHPLFSEWLFRDHNMGLLENKATPRRVAGDDFCNVTSIEQITYREHDLVC